MNGNLNVLVKKYLLKNLNSVWQLETGTEKLYDNIMVVPAIQEKENIKLLLKSLSKCDNKYFDSTLVVFVINAVSNSSAVVLDESAETLNCLRGLIHQDVQGDETLSGVVSSRLNIGVIDASTGNKAMPEKDGGVGLARKIGMDLALQYFDYNSLNKNLLICLDADCTVEKNYLTEIADHFKKNSCGAAVVNFKHPLSDDENEKLAIINYEIFLRYYVLGLKFAGSPYAFHSIGSTIVCDVESYIKAGGMNKKKAGEDFYFLEKLAKITKVGRIKTTLVYPSGRPSWRVPFGTGRSVGKFLSNVQNKLSLHDEYLLYSPESFFILKKWLNEFHSEKIFDANYYMKCAKEINQSLFEFLKENSFEQSWQKILKNSSDAGQINIQKKLWFDGFRTLKLIHYLRDNSFPCVNMFDALDQMLTVFGLNGFRTSSEEIPPIEIQLKYLNKLFELT